MNTRTIKLLIVPAGILAVLCLVLSCAIGAALSSRSAGPALPTIVVPATAPATAVAIATAPTAVPAIVVVPTAVPPTAVAIATSTPYPTRIPPTALPACTVEEYLRSTFPAIEDWESTREAIDKALDERDADAVVSSLKHFRALRNQFSDVQAPACAEDFRTLVLQGMDAYLAGWQAGIDGDMESAKRSFQLSADAWSRAGVLLRKLRGLQG